MLQKQIKRIFILRLTLRGQATEKEFFAYTNVRLQYMKCPSIMFVYETMKICI